MEKFKDLPNGSNLKHSQDCWKHDDVLVNKHKDFVRTKSDIIRMCGACEVSSVCMALVSEHTVDVYPKKVKTNVGEYTPTSKKPIRGKKRKGKGGV